MAWGDGWVEKVDDAMAEIPDAMAAHVSVENQFPEDLYEAMLMFISSRPDRKSVV